MKNLTEKFTIVFFLLVSISSFVACDKDEDEENNTPPPPAATGVYIVNEGAFGAGNASISFYNLQNGVMTNDYYQSANGVPLGDVANSMIIHQSKAYIVVNNSQKIEVVNEADFVSTGTITGFQGPRHIMAVSNKAYVCDWFSNEVAVVDLTTNSIIKHIPVGTGPEQSTIAGTQLWVANQGGFGSDSTVSVIDLFTDVVTGTMTVGINPNSIVTDKYGKVWVLCGGSTGPDFIGGTADDIAGSLWKINPNTLIVEKQFTMSSSHHPVKMKMNGDKTEIFYLLGDNLYSGVVYKINVSANQLSGSPFINKTFYGLGIDDDNGNIYGGSSPGFSQNGYMVRYTPTATLIDSLQVGIAPNGFVFK